MTSSVAEVLAGLPVTRLIHFTSAVNLYGIFRDGMIRTTADLEADPQQHHTVTDRQRSDGHPEHICCSFEYPNAYYQSVASAKFDFANYPDWVCLDLDPSLVLREGTIFYPCNGATASGAYQATGGAGLARLWSNPSIPSNRSRSLTHHPAVPTDLQAEVQVPGSVPLSQVRAIIAESPGRCRELFGSLQPHGVHPEQLEWRWAPLFFRKYQLASAIQTSTPIEEHIWSPGPEDLA